MGGGKGRLVKGYKLPVKIRINSRGLTYSVVTVVSNKTLYI